MGLMDDVPWVYGAARAATADEDVALDVTERVLRAAAPDSARRTLVAEAVRQAIRIEPAAPFAGLDRGDAEALALVRLAGLSAAEVADATGEDRATVSRRLTAALRTLARPRLVA
jgi:DNA-directed RNA polymerase specialized sigma24 family protein